MSSASMSTPSLKDAVETALRRGIEWSLERQHKDGYWVGRLQSNACMEAQWVLALHFLGLPEHPLRARLGRAILREQRSDGSWEVFYGAPAGDINTTIECYAALRSLGHAPDEPPLRRARDFILRAGGVGKARVFTKYWLSLIGAWSWMDTPNLPPEIVFLPTSVVFNVYHFASWARATLMPLAVLSAHRPVAPLPGGDRLDELFPAGRGREVGPVPGGAWERFFHFVDRRLHHLQSWGLVPFRRSALDRVLEWIVRHQDADGVWGGIQPPWIYSLLALKVGGYALDHPVLAKGLAALDDPSWRLDIEDASYVSASISPVWDTLLTMLALEDAGEIESSGERFERAYEWIMAKEVRFPGDWAVKRPGIEPSGWAFEHENHHYPDLDDTAVALMVLARLRDHPRYSGPRIEAAIRRGTHWILGLQCKSGGWAAFDPDNHHVFLTKIPFCDFGEVLDPPSADVTSHVLEALALLGYDRIHPAVARGIEFLAGEQESDGSWFGRWGVNYVYGTGAALTALAALGLGRTSMAERGADWLVAHQGEDGGWGESCSSYMDPCLRGRGPSTPSQTAWALMGLSAVRRPQDRRSWESGLSWLIERQEGGTWDEPWFTGTGFPGYGVGQHVRVDDPAVRARVAQGPELSRAFMLNYNLYRHYFPLMALARFRALPTM